MKKELTIHLSFGRTVLFLVFFLCSIAPLLAQNGTGKRGKLSIRGNETCYPRLAVNIQSVTADSSIISFREASPLDTIAVMCAGARTLEVYDGGGICYVRKAFQDIGSFQAGGRLGKQQIVLLDGTGKEMKRHFFTLDAKTSIDDQGPYKELFDLLYKGMCVYAPGGVESSDFEGKTYHYFVSWVLDNYNTNMGMRYFSPYGSEMIDLFSQVQWDDGMIPSNIQHGRPGYFDVAYGNLNYVKHFGETFFVRQPNENHVEYLFVNLLFKAWQASGDDAWMKGKLQSAERALDYGMQDSLRWSKRFGLLKRPYTIDSWDFQVEDQYTPQDALTPTMCIVPGKTKFGVFYGDNTGYAEACRQLALMMDRAGEPEGSAKFSKRADEVMKRLNALSWNGHFFTHFIDEDPSVKRDLGVDEKSQISQFNAYSINRGLSHEQNVAIIKSYLNLRDNLPQGSPGEWYAIYPPFEKGFGGHNQKWQYMNGGIAGHAIGELARGAYENGFEEYGSNNLDRLLELGKKYGKGERIWFAYTGAYPAPPPAPVYTAINLSTVVNMDILDKGGPGVPGWMAERAGNDMRNLPVGKQTFNGVPFLITDPATNKRKAVIGLSRQKGFPMEVTIPIQSRAAAIHLLHTLGNAGSEGIAGLVKYQYSDGSSRSQYIINGKHLTTWWFPNLENKLAGVAWRGPNGVSNDVGMCSAVLLNPEPEKKIASLTLSASEDMGIYVVAGLTLADREPYIKPSPESFGGPDNWAAALGMAALVEGLAGVTDRDVCFRNVQLAPRWTSSRSQQAEVTIRYAASESYISYQYAHHKEERAIFITLTGSGERVHCHLLLPPLTGAIHSILCNGTSVEFTQNAVEKSSYADFSIALKGTHEIVLRY